MLRLFIYCTSAPLSKLQFFFRLPFLSFLLRFPFPPLSSYFLMHFPLHAHHKCSVARLHALQIFVFLFFLELSFISLFPHTFLIRLPKGEGKKNEIGQRERREQILISPPPPPFVSSAVPSGRVRRRRGGVAPRTKPPADEP